VLADLDGVGGVPLNADLYAFSRVEQVGAFLEHPYEIRLRHDSPLSSLPA
jgi:hypothetical protein